MKYIPILLIFLVFCNHQNNQKGTDVTSKVLDTINVKSNVLIKDTTIFYNIDGISSEGTEARVEYIKGRIRESLISIYGETGQSKIFYKFLDDSIEVLEKDFVYKTNLLEVKSDKDIILKKEIIYYIDIDGNLKRDTIKDRIDIFKEFKKNVPFILLE
ncbi:hypothetical protein [uncultured Dysgonomonas sp.]|uniref:hypothetical protein n=1 Tax=uncultured Dysgonomonas sp. TaxID=206096 RepID=UPI002805B002|nr:hypothetical protein [uncultured Dysgonomonas sp.]